MLDFVFEDNAIKVQGLPLWLDSSNFRSDKSPVRRPLNFVSHAHADHIGRHKRIICTPETLKLMKSRIKVEEAITLEYGEKRDIAGACISLYPAGHVLGSAQILIEQDGQRLCYTGDFRLGQGLTTERCEAVACDILLMECTYGHEKYVFPERKELLTEIENFVEGCFDRLEFPVILGYSLGKAQEAIKAATILGYGSVVHPAIYKICRIYKEFGVDFHNLSEIGKRPVGRRVIVFPPHKRVWQGLASMGKIRTAVLTGWATDSWRKTLYGADEAIPYSDHCDFNQLLETAKTSGAKKILTHHGEAERFAGKLEARGFNAYPLIPSSQAKLF